MFGRAESQRSDRQTDRQTRPCVSCTARNEHNMPFQNELAFFIIFSLFHIYVLSLLIIINYCQQSTIDNRQSTIDNRLYQECFLLLKFVTPQLFTQQFHPSNNYSKLNSRKKKTAINKQTHSSTVRYDGTVPIDFSL
jgi:hypothetical protein